MMKPFWMVLADSSSSTVYRHASASAARTEAERLALLHPGIKFHVLQQIGMAEAQRPVTWTETDQIPF
jgi:hypothetical protein